MGARTLIPVEEYLRTSYRPDCDYVDGEVVERNMGERDHNRLQKALLFFFGPREKQWGVEVLQEQRVEVSPSRFRVPDLCMVFGEFKEQVLREPPFLCIEILSPEDRWSRVQQRLEDYIRMGVPNVWVLDPATKQAFTVTEANGAREVTGGVLRTADPVFEVPLAEIFG